MRKIFYSLGTTKNTLKRYLRTLIAVGVLLASPVYADTSTHTSSEKNSFSHLGWSIGVTPHTLSVEGGEDGTS